MIKGHTGQEIILGSVAVSRLVTAETPKRDILFLTNTGRACLGKKGRGGWVNAK